MNGSGRQTTEADLVRLARNKDTAAVRAIYDSCAQYLFAVCRRYVGDPDSAADVLQDLKSWMRRIVVNEALMYLRNRRRSAGLVADEALPDVPDEDPDVDNVPMPVLQQMIAGLPDGYRTVFNLYVFEGMSHRQIAGALGISENTSYSQVSRAKSLLAAKIKEYRENEQQ